MWGKFVEVLKAWWPSQVSGIATSPSTPEEGLGHLVYTKNFDDVLRAESDEIIARRKHNFPKAEPDANDLVGLALSGGGIRSAAFCMGGLQALAIKNILQRTDYISTVSGGGYVGIATSVAMNESQGIFPFARDNDIKDTAEMGTFRNNTNYLRFGKFWPMLKNLAIVTKGFAINLALVAGVIVLLAAFTLWANPTIKSLAQPGFHFSPLSMPVALDGLPFGVTLILIFITLSILVIWAVSAGLFASFEDFKGNWVSLAAVLLLLTAGSAFFELQPILVSKMIPNATLIQGPAKSLATSSCAKQTLVFGKSSMQQAVSCSESNFIPANSSSLDDRPFKRFVDWLQTLLAPALAFIAFASKYVGDLMKANEGESGWRPTIKRLTGRLIIWGAALALPLVLWAGYLGLVYWGLLEGPLNDLRSPFAPTWLRAQMLSPSNDKFGLHSFWLTYLGIGIILLIPWLLAMFQPNANSLHGLYRGRLGNAFIKPWSGLSGLTMKLSTLSSEHSPFHIINAALNVQASPTVNRSGRNADFFSFSMKYVGSHATGFVATHVYEKDEPQLDVSTAMAISGAAASSNMGAQSIRPLTFTLALLNIRLGAWLLNPMVYSNAPPSKMPSHFLAELTGRLKEDTRQIYLTDGGHIENLGAYELLRRRCKLIVIVDAEADRDMNFSSLITLQRYARIDLGVRVDIDVSKIRAQAVLAHKNQGNAAIGPHSAIGKLEYDDGSSGVLVYIKSSVSGDENDYIKDYNRRNPDFPHETTADQFFSEEQFEVYRALGFHAMDGFLNGNHAVQTSNKTLERFTNSDAKGYGVSIARKLLAIKSKAVA